MAVPNPIAYYTSFIASIRKRTDLGLSDAQKQVAIEGIEKELEEYMAQGIDSPWLPINHPQGYTIVNEADITFLGGGASGGKSFCILGNALTCQTRSLILRKEATQLRQLKDDLFKLKRPDDKWVSIGYGGRLTPCDRDWETKVISSSVSSDSLPVSPS